MLMISWSYSEVADFPMSLDMSLFIMCLRFPKILLWCTTVADCTWCARGYAEKYLLIIHDVSMSMMPVFKRVAELLAICCWCADTADVPMLMMCRCWVNIYLRKILSKLESEAFLFKQRNGQFNCFLEKLIRYYSWIATANFNKSNPKIDD
jgi:hypothetical protein